MTRHPTLHSFMRRHATALGLSILVGLIAILVSGKAHGVRDAAWSAGAPTAAVAPAAVV